MNVVRVEDVVSKGGNPMLVFYLDIVAGEFTAFFHRNSIRYYREYGTELGLQITKGVLTAFVRSNPGSLSMDDITSNTFDHNRLQGLLVGALIDEGSNGYLEIKSLLDTDSINKNQLPPKTAAIQPPVAASDNSSFDELVS